MSLGTTQGSSASSWSRPLGPAELLDDLVGRIRDLQRAAGVVARVASWRRLDPVDQGRQLPAIYLAVEHYLVHVEQQDRSVLHEALAARFAALLEADSRIGLIFADEEQQQVLLAREFFSPLLHDAIQRLGDAAHPSLMTLVRWLDDVGDPNRPSPVPEPLSVPESDGWSALLARLGRDLYERLAELLGEAETRALFNDNYRAMAQSYLGLPAFIAVVRLLPPEILDEGQLSILSRDQTRRVLIEKLAEMQAMNDQLSEKNADMEMALGVLERSNDELEQRVAERTAELEEAAARLAESEDRLRRISEAAGDGIAMIDDRGRVAYLNEAAARLLGYDRDELLGESLVETAVPERFRERITKTFSGALATGQGPGVGLTAEFVARRRDGSEVPVEISLASVRHQGSWHLVGVVRDISQRKRLESERKRLADRVQESQRLESLGAVAGGIAHDFNNLLTAIVGHAGLMETADQSFPFHENVEEIQKAAQRATDLTRQMLAFSGRGHFIKETVDLVELVSELRADLWTAMPANAHLALDLDAAIPPVIADRSQLGQVLGHLTANAAEALAEDGGVVTIRTRVAEVDRSRLDRASQGADAPEGRYVVLEVADSGHGMDPETMAKIFEPFFSTRFTGRGLGLAAVSGVVRGHQGVLEVRSEPGEGTAVRVLLPPAELIPVKPAIERPSDPAVTGRVLVVDDEPGVRFLARKVLETFGFEVITANDGQEAVDRVREDGDTIDLVLLDLTMPNMDGEQAFEAIHALRPELEVVLSSGYDRAEIMDRFADREIAGFVQKPYAIDRLLAEVRRALNRRTG